jgi:hypothetical protein
MELAEIFIMGANIESALHQYYEAALLLAKDGDLLGATKVLKVALEVLKEYCCWSEING